MQIRGSNQIMPGTITADRLVSNLALGLSQLAEGADIVKRDGSVPFTAAISHGGNRITNVGTPTASTDAATKGYVDAAVQGLDLKESVRVATTAPITLSGTQTIDGVLVIAGDRVLVKNQADPAANGIYTVNVGAWTRASDADESAEVDPGMFLFVQEGATNGDTGWVLTADTIVVVGVTGMNFSQFSSAGTISAGAGLTKTGNTIDVGAGFGINVGADAISVQADVTDNNIEVVSGGVRIKRGTAAGQLMVTQATSFAPTPVALSGDATLSAGGVLTLASNVVREADYVAVETLTGTPNGVLAAFTLAATPVTGSVQIFVNGLLQRPTTDYSVSGNTVTFTTVPALGDWLAASYFKA